MSSAQSDVVIGIAEGIASDVGANVLWQECTELVRYVKEKRAQSHESITEADADKAAADARRASDVAAALPPSNSPRISNFAADGSLWRLEFEANGKRVEAHVVAVATGTVVDKIHGTD